MTHEAFANAGQQPGLEIWRIEDFEPVPYPKKDYGKFYTGDSYIVLATHDRGKGQLSWSLHFWLGKETSQDESGAAAVLTVQLDDHLGGGPEQYREVQQHESTLFLSHFKAGVRYLAGGIASGFHHVDPDAPQPARLFQVKGKKHIRVWQVPVGVSSLNSGDCFILDAAPEKVFVYQGKNSKRLEKIKAIGVGNQVRDQDHGGRPEVVVIDEFSSSGELSEFFEALGGGSQDDVPNDDGGDDAESEKNGVASLHRISDDEGSLKVSEIARGELQQDMLDSSDCFILDTSHASLFIWIGRSCSPAERSGAIKLADKFCKENNYPAHTKIQRVVEGAEPAAFRELFSSEWQDPQHGNECGVRRAWHCKLARGVLQVTEVFDVEQEDLDEDDVFIVDVGKVLYVWVGKESSEQERALSSSRAEKLKRFGDLGNIVTVEQEQEPEEFTSYFPEWDADFWNSVGSYEDRRNAALK